MSSVTLAEAVAVKATHGTSFVMLLNLPEMPLFAMLSPQLLYLNLTINQIPLRN